MKNNKRELDDNKLENVTGGVTSRTTTVYDFATNELFFDGQEYHVVLFAQGKLEENDLVEVKSWEAGNYWGGSYGYKTVKELLSFQSLGVVDYTDYLKL